MSSVPVGRLLVLDTGECQVSLSDVLVASTAPVSIFIHIHIYFVFSVFLRFLHGPFPSRMWQSMRLSCFTLFSLRLSLSFHRYPGILLILPFSSPLHRCYSLKSNCVSLYVLVFILLFSCRNYPLRLPGSVVVVAVLKYPISTQEWC